MSPADEPKTRRLTPERIAEIEASSAESEAERARKHAVCAHPGDRRRNVTWGVVCDVCQTRVG